LLPPSALDTLARLHIEYPMLFEVSSVEAGKRTHCGVLEFSAPEGSAYIPFWMMQNLMLEEGGMVLIKNVSLPKASYVKFKPQSMDFLDITNPRAVLERALRSFSCVTKGDTICIPYNSKKYYLEVCEVKPADAACIIETDCNVDFEAPVGYEEHIQRQSQAASEKLSSQGGGGGASSVAGSVGAASSNGVLPNVPVQQARRKKADEEGGPKFSAFSGGGVRLDGKPLNQKQLESSPQTEARKMAQSQAAAAPEPSPVVRPVASRPQSAARRFAKRKTAGAFIGSGNKMS